MIQRERELIEALRPLASLYTLIDGDDSNDLYYFIHDGGIVTYGDIRHAYKLVSDYYGEANWYTELPSPRSEGHD